MTSNPASKSFTRFFPAIVQVLMGLPLCAFGVNAFWPFIPQPSTPLPPKAQAFAGALMASGYMMKLIGGTQLVVGALLVLNVFVPLALVLFAPFIVNAMAFHLCLEPSGLPMAGVFLAFELYLVWVYRAAYRPLFTARAG